MSNTVNRVTPASPPPKPNPKRSPAPGAPGKEQAGPGIQKDQTRLTQRKGRPATGDLVAEYPTGSESATGAPDLTLGKEIAQLKAKQSALNAAEVKAKDGHAVARGFNHLLGTLGDHDEKLGVARAAAQTAMTRELNAALATYHKQVAAKDPGAEVHLRSALDRAGQRVAAYDQALARYKEHNKFWSGIAADVTAGAAVVAGVAGVGLTATGLGAPIGVPLLAAGAFVGGGAAALAARATLDNQFDLGKEGASTFAVGGVSGVATAVTGGASQALTAGLATQASRVVGQQAVQGAVGQAAIRAGANAIVGAGVGASTSGVQAIASGQDAEAVARAMVLGGLGGAAGSAATAGASATLGRSARAFQQSTAAGSGVVSRTVSAATRASETAAGRAAGAMTQGVVTGGTSGGAAALANQLASGQPVDFGALRRQILAGAIQGGFSVAAGHAAAALPKRSPVRAPLSPEDAQARISALAPKGNPALSREFWQLGDQYRQAQETALARMGALQAKHRELAGVSDADARASALAESVNHYGEAMARLDGTRAQLLDFGRQHLGRAKTLELARAVGEPNPNVAWDRPLNAGSQGKHNEAVAGFVTRFADLGLSDVAQPGVRGLSSRALQSISESLNTEASSADAKGAANVEHLASVLKGNLLTARREKGAPLTQAEVDTRAAVTVLTDAWMKGASPDVLASVRTASTNLGANGKAIYENMLARGLKIDSLDQVPTGIRPQLNEWFTKFGPPPTKEAVAKALAEKGLAAAEVDVWANRIMARDRQVTNPFLLGTWLHGMPQFEAVNGVVKSMGGDRAMARNYYEEVLAHHASGFVMDGFSRARMNVNFYEMARAGQLTPEAAQRLTGLYTSSTALAGKWRPVIDMATSGKPLGVAQYTQFRQAVGLRPLSAREQAEYRQLNGGQGRSLTAEEYQMFRRRYGADAAPVREAIARLTPNSRAQLLNDDSQQFTVIGMPKWINMMNTMGKPATNGDLIDLVYRGAVQPYAEESYARGASVGTAFDQSTAPVAERLGMTLDPRTRSYRPATGGEQGQARLSARILADPTLRARLNAESVDPSNPQAVIDWFRSQAVDPARVTELVQTDLAP